MPYKSLYKLKNFGIILIQNNFEDINMSVENTLIDPNTVKEGDTIALKYYYFGEYSHEDLFIVEYFRFALGVFLSDDARTAGNFTPLCELYQKGEDSKQDYISNYGEYITNKIPAWRIVSQK